MTNCRLKVLWLYWYPNPSRPWPGYRRLLVQASYPPLLEISARVTLLDSREFPLHYVSTSPLKYSWELSPFIFPQPLPDSSCSCPYLHPVHPCYLVHTPSQIILKPTFSCPCYLASLGLWIVAWLSFTLQLIPTYKWLHAMFVFLGLGYLTQAFFFLVASICLQIS